MRYNITNRSDRTKTKAERDAFIYKTPEEIADLSEEERIAYRNEVVLLNIPLAKTIAIKNSMRGVDVEDLTQEGVIGLHTATERYDTKKGAFSTYATWW